MRSIGKRNILLVQIVTKEVVESGDYSFSQVEDIVVEKLPKSLWDIWEMADQEIRRVISDVVFKYE